MNKIDLTVVWAPRVFGRERLGPGRWSLVIDAPFAMRADIPDLLGMRVHLDGRLFDIRGIVPRMPPGPIGAGELIELLAAEVAQPDPAAAPSHARS